MSTDVIRELEGKIVATCIQNKCGHLRWTGGGHCDRKSKCHSSKVRKWLAEIKSLEEKGR